MSMSCFTLRGACTALRFKRRRRDGAEHRRDVDRFGGWLPPVSGAIFEEVIDLAAMLDALRAAISGGELSDY